MAWGSKDETNIFLVKNLRPVVTDDDDDVIGRSFDRKKRREKSLSGELKLPLSILLETASGRDGGRDTDQLCCRSPSPLLHPLLVTRGVVIL